MTTVKLGIYLRSGDIVEPALQFLSKDLEINWLRNAGIATGPEETRLLGHQRVGGNGDNRNAAKLWQQAHPGIEGEPILLAELDIQQDSIGCTSLHGSKDEAKGIRNADLLL